MLAKRGRRQRGVDPLAVEAHRRSDYRHDPKRASAACRREDAVARGVTLANDPQNGKDEVAREARRNEAVKRYHELPGGAGYPGIACQILHKC